VYFSSPHRCKEGNRDLQRFNGENNTLARRFIIILVRRGEWDSPLSLISLWTSEAG